MMKVINASTVPVRMPSRQPRGFSKHNRVQPPPREEGGRRSFGMLDRESGSIEGLPVCM